VGDNKNRRRTDFPCRSVYLPVIRNDLPELFDVFDFAEPHATTGMRPQTMVATQGLFMLNDDTVIDAADSVARHLSKDVADKGAEAAIEKMFALLLNAPTTDEERSELLAFIRETQQRLSDQGDKDAALRAWAMACHALFASSRFQLLE
jgi:hypothetical protein